MSDNTGASGRTDPYEGFVALYKDRIVPLSAIRGGQEETKEKTMEDKRAKELQRKINQYELLVDLLTATHKYSGVLTVEYILVALEAAAGVLEQDLGEDSPGGVEDSPIKLPTPYVPVLWTEQTASFADHGPTSVTYDHMSHVHEAQSGSENESDR